MLYPTYTQRDPFAGMRPAPRGFNRAPTARGAQTAFPAVNIWQGDEAVAVTAELPGVNPADVDITVKDTVLTITGERRAPDMPDDATWLRNERGYGKFSRAIRLPYAAANDKIDARMVNGVLRVLIGRPEQDKPKKIEIKAA